MKIVTVIAVAMLLAGPLAGCITKKTHDDEPVDITGGVAIDNKTTKKLELLAAPTPSIYSFPSDGLPKVAIATTFFNGTVGMEANGGVESAQDRGGTSFNSVLVTDDFSSFVPAGQPTLINARLWYDNAPGKSADLDIYVDSAVGVSQEATEYADEVTWTLPVKTKSVTTVGDGSTLIGVQAANGRLAPGQTINFWMRLEFIYGDNVAAPQVPYALDVGQNVTGLIVESVKFAGDTHVKGRFVIVDPNDNLVQAMTFDDIAIPTQSVYVPVNGPGTYVFYTIDVKNGFFRVRADAPLDDWKVTPLKKTVTDMVLFTDPVAPGMAEHYAYDRVTDYQEGASVPFSVDGAFPLELRPFIQGDGFTGDVELRASNTQGEVAAYHRFLRYDSAEGKAGMSDDRLHENNRLNAENLARGAHTLSVVANGNSGQAGVRIVSYAR